MVYRLTCAVSTNDELLLQQFKARLSPAGIKASDLASPDSRYSYLELQWDDTGIPAAPENHGSHRAGAKPKKLLLDGRPATCGQVWHLREKDHLSDAAVGSVLDASESTITRRRKSIWQTGIFIQAVRLSSDCHKIKYSNIFAGSGNHRFLFLSGYI